MPDDWTKLVVLDTETSGLSPYKCQVLTLDAQLVLRGTDRQGRTVFTRTDKTIHLEVARQHWALIEPSALAVTGIDINAWKGESEAEALGKLNQWIVSNTGSGYKVLCGYNVGFDRQFIEQMLKRNTAFKWTNLFSYRVFDVLQLVQWAFLTGLIRDPKDFKLETIAKQLGVWTSGAHDSSVDVGMTISVMEAINALVQKSA